jgi:hypothetical protein
VFITSHSFVYLTDKGDGTNGPLPEPVYQNATPLNPTNDWLSGQRNGPLDFKNGWCACFTTDNLDTFSNKLNNKHENMVVDTLPNTDCSQDTDNGIEINTKNEWESQQVTVYIGENQR